MKKLMILFLTISNYLESSSIIKKSLDYISIQDQTVSRKATFQIRNSNIEKTLLSYINYLKTGEGEDIDWDNLKKKGFIVEDADKMKRYIRAFYFDTPNILDIAHPQLPAWIDHEFDNVTNELALKLEEFNEISNLAKLGPISIRKGIIHFIMLDKKNKYYYVKKDLRQNFLEQEKLYKRKFLYLISQNISKFEHIKNIDVNNINLDEDCEYLIVQAQDLSGSALVINATLRKNNKLKVITAFDDNTTTINNGFMLNNAASEGIIIGLNIKDIGDHCFLTSGPTLETLDLTPLINVTSIGDNFLIGCQKIISLDFTSFKKLIYIGNNFLYGCPSLSVLDFRGLENLRGLGKNFLANCKEIKELDFTPLKNLTNISDNCLANCTGLRILDLKGLENVNYIGKNFLENCEGITELDFTQFKNVTSIGDNFLSGCSGLTTILLPDSDNKKLFLDKIPKNNKITIIIKTNE